MLFVCKIGGRYLSRGRLVRKMKQAEIFSSLYRDDYTFIDAEEALRRLGIETIPIEVETKIVQTIRRKPRLPRTSVTPAKYQPSRSAVHDAIEAGQLHLEDE